MTRQVVATLFAALFISCGDASNSAPVANSQTAVASNAEADPPVLLVPSVEAVEAMPGIYVATVFQRPKPGIQIEKMEEIFFIETVYDARGREAATSVPSSRWSLLSEESRITLAGMRSGDRRRIWRCADGSKNPCRVEEVQVFDGAEAR